MPKTRATLPAPPSVLALVGLLSQVRPMRRGSLSQRSMKCGKPGCPCQKDPTARHGPYFSVTRGVGGSTRSRYVNPEQAAIVRRQVEAAQEFRKVMAALWEACEAWADAELEASEGHPEVAEKGGSGSRLAQRSRRRSRPS